MGENKDGTKREKESRYVTFIKKEFPKLGEANDEFTFYKVQY